MKRIDEEQRFREERAAARDRGREPGGSSRSGRRELAGRDALRLKLADRGAAQDDDPDPAGARVVVTHPSGEPDDERMVKDSHGRTVRVRQWEAEVQAAAPEPVDLDMRPRDVGAANCWMAYTKGWRVGAKGGVPDPAATGHADRGIAQAYQDGYAAGLEAFNRAARAAAERYGYMPSPLRTEQTP